MATLVSPRMPIWGNSTSAPIWFPLTQFVLAADYQPVRWQVEFLCSSSSTDNLVWAAGFQFANVPDSPLSPQTFSNSTSPSSVQGWTFSNAFLNISNPGVGYDIGRYIRFGVWAMKLTNNNLNYARARIVVDGRVQG